MRAFLTKLFIPLTLFAMPFLAAADVDDSDRIDALDIQALRDWINTKRQVTVRERGGNLSISAEVRVEMQATNERKRVDRLDADGNVVTHPDGRPVRYWRQQRGNGGAVPNTATYAWDVEVNLMLDYRTERTWAAVKLEFDNNMGTVSGTGNRLDLEKAYFGGRFIAADTYTMDLEAGRRPNGNVFDSRIEFGSTLDGVVYRYDQAFDAAGDFYVHCAGFIIDERKNHYGYVGEIALLNIMNTGFYSKYSLINWSNLPTGTPLEKQRWKFIVSQFLVGYKCVPKWLDKILTFYAAGLVNSDASRLQITNNTKSNLGAYIGFSAGEVRKAGDWSFDANYQVVQAQAIPSIDMSGVGRGNAARAGLYTTNKNGSGSPTTQANAVGDGNFKGFQVELLFLASNNITILQAYRQSWTLNKSIGPKLDYKQYEIEFIYAF